MARARRPARRRVARGNGADHGFRPRSTDRRGALLRRRLAALDRRGDLVGRAVDSWRRHPDHLDRRPRGARSSRRQPLVGFVAQVPAGRPVRRARDRGLCRRRDRPQARDRTRLPAGSRRFRRQPALRPAPRRASRGPPAGGLLSRLAFLERVLADGLLFPAGGCTAPARPAAPGRRPCARDGLCLRPGGPRGSFPVPRPHERGPRLVPAARALGPAAKIRGEPPAAIDRRRPGRPTAGSSRAGRTGT